MHTDTSLITAFLVGLLGGVHCVGMCGGIVSTLTMGLPRSVRGSLAAQMPFQLAYNAGRVAGYTLAGGLTGALGALMLRAIPLQQAQRVLFGLAAVFMVALGLYLGGWWRGLAWLERAGAPIWRRLEPFGRRMVPVRSPWQAPRPGCPPPMQLVFDCGPLGGDGRPAAGPEDGFLTALEISELALDARLVVLSGCGTGTGSLFKGEGIKGLSEAFRRAGTDSLVVSLWSVDDRATAVFMGRFYRRLAAGDPPARALGRAKREMIASRYGSPFHWAAFVLTGLAADRPIR